MSKAISSNNSVLLEEWLNIPKLLNLVETFPGELKLL